MSVYVQQSQKLPWKIYGEKNFMGVLKGVSTDTQRCNKNYIITLVLSMWPRVLSFLDIMYEQEFYLETEEWFIMHEV